VLESRSSRVIGHSKSLTRFGIQLTIPWKRRKFSAMFVVLRVLPAQKQCDVLAEVVLEARNVADVDGIGLQMRV
jgi:hypothetical protein